MRDHCLKSLTTQAVNAHECGITACSVENIQSNAKQRQSAATSLRTQHRSHHCKGKCQHWKTTRLKQVLVYVRASLCLLRPQPTSFLSPVILLPPCFLEHLHSPEFTQRQAMFLLCCGLLGTVSSVCSLLCATSIRASLQKERLSNARHAGKPHSANNPPVLVITAARRAKILNAMAPLTDRRQTPMKAVRHPLKTSKPHACKEMFIRAFQGVPAGMS